MGSKTYKYFAFISYSHADVKEAKRLQRMLEHYNLPAKIRKAHRINAPKRLNVFRDSDELTGGILDEVLRKNLEDSKYLIVICSQASAASKYVGEEIFWFRDSGRGADIIPFIIKGMPHSPDNECFNPMLYADGQELLGIDVQAETGWSASLRFHKAFIRLVARMFDLDFSVLWNRRKHFLYKVYVFAALIVLILSLLVALLINSVPFDAKFHLDAKRGDLPLNVMDTDTLQVLINGVTHKMTLHGIADPIVIADLPGRNKGADCRVTGHIYGYLPIDTTLVLNGDNHIILAHDLEVYGNIRYILMDDATDSPLAHAEVIFDFGIYHTDESGLLELMVPIECQKRSYPVSVRHQGVACKLPDDSTTGFEITSVYPSPDALLIYLSKDDTP